jgi:glycosyltransferase involved in cell wall biosynthesis
METNLRSGYLGGSMVDTIIRQPLVSVITIFLNAGKFIQEAIESVFAQTYDEWELLLVDDGSTDGSTEIALGYARQYPKKVRYLKHDGHQNRGMSASRNLGIGNARGEYIAFLDADDVWLPHKLEQQVAILDSYPVAGMVFGSTQYWYSWAGNSEDSQSDSVREIGVLPNTLYQPPQLLTLLLQNRANAPATCSVLIRRRVFDEVGRFEDIFRGLFEDRAFFAKVYLRVPVYVSSECWDRYRQHPDSCCSVAERTGQLQLSRPNPEHLNFLNWMMEYLSKQEIRDEEVWQALQKGFWPYNHPILYRLSRIKKRLEYIWG